jgi:hypothetical protein
MRKILGICLMVMLMISLYSLALAGDVEIKNISFINEQVRMMDPVGNETEVPDENETDGSSENETENPDGNETDNPDGNETDIDDETEEEIEIMNTTLGAEIRLLQLEKAITKNLLKGERAVAVLDVMGFNTTELEGILDNLQLVLEEVQGADASANDSVQQFIDLKSDSKNLTKEFRDAVKALLSDQKIKELREQVQNIVGDMLQNYSKQIQNRIKQFNRNQLHRLYGIIGETNESFLDAYQNGTLSMEEMKSQISKMVNKMTKEKKNQLFSELKKEKINKKAFADEEASDALTGFEERANERAQERSNKGNNGQDNNNGKGNGKGHS